MINVKQIEKLLKNLYERRKTGGKDSVLNEIEYIVATEIVEDEIGNPLCYYLDDEDNHENCVIFNEVSEALRNKKKLDKLIVEVKEHLTRDNSDASIVGLQFGSYSAYMEYSEKINGCKENTKKLTIYITYIRYPRA